MIINYYDMYFIHYIPGSLYNQAIAILNEQEKQFSIDLVLRK